MAGAQADDGFYDKAIAVLGKAQRLAPTDELIPKRINQYRTAKKMEKRRSLAIEGLLANKSADPGTSAGNRALEIELMWNKIAKCHLVRDLSPESLKKLFSVMRMSSLRADTVLVEEGEQRQVIYLVVDGVIEAEAPVNDQMMAIRTFSTGHVIGDRSLLERKPWPARYRVAEAGTVFELDRPGMEETMKGNEDPMGFLNALRQQQNDRDVAANLLKIRGR